MGGQAVAALIVIPIIIAASAPFILLKFPDFFRQVGRFFKKLWNEYWPGSNRDQNRRRRRLRRSNLPTYQLYADSWADLQSTGSEEELSNLGGRTLVGQQTRRSLSEGDQPEEIEPTPSRIWHPTRSSRLQWSFTDPRSQSPNRSGSSSVVRPSRAAQRPERLSAEDAALLARPISVAGARRMENSSGSTDL